MSLYAPTVSEAILDVLIASPREWGYQAMREEIEKKYIILGCANGIRKNLFLSALKSLKNRKLIKTLHQYDSDSTMLRGVIFPRQNSGILSYESQVRPLSDAECILSTNKIQNKKSHYVYYVQWENDPDYVKIGYSSRPTQRFAEFLTSNPHRLSVLRTEEVDDPLAEIGIHNKFKNFRVNREWFLYSGKLKEYINCLSCETNIKIDQSLSSYQRDNIFVHYF